MKNYKITVNGNLYEVTVEECSAQQMSTFTAQNAVNTPAPVPMNSAPVAAAPAPAAVSEPVAPAPPVANGTQGATKINAPMPGKILSVNVNVGKSVKKGEALMILEAMKMENEIVAPKDGIVASINVSAGSSVESGEVLVTLN